MRARLKSFARRGLAVILRALPVRLVETALRALITLRADGLPPAEALRFLFRLDAAIYALEGSMAVAYGGGLHTKHRHTHYHDFFVDRIGIGDRVLDIGCGNGALAADIAARKNAFVVGVDTNAESIAEARQRHPGTRLRFEVADALGPLPEGAFDVVVLSNVLEHLVERPEFLRRIGATVRPGRILVRVPLWERDWRVPLKHELGVEWRLDPTHETEYTQESFREEISKAGLRIVHQEIRWGEIWAEAVPNGAPGSREA